MNARVADLLRFLDASPTPFHAVAEVRRRLEAAGFVELREEEAFRLGPGDSGFVVRSGASLVAFQFDTYLLRNFGIAVWWWAAVALVATWPPEPASTTSEE